MSLKNVCLYFENSVNDYNQSLIVYEDVVKQIKDIISRLKEGEGCGGKKNELKENKNKNEKGANEFYSLVKSLDITLFRTESDEGILQLIEKISYTYNDCVNLMNERETMFNFLFEIVEPPLQREIRDDDKQYGSTVIANKVVSFFKTKFSWKCDCVQTRDKFEKQENDVDCGVKEMKWKIKR
ncbi:hypothetical protein ACTA71_007307 [Dictyostelium dimigraforme]